MKTVTKRSSEKPVNDNLITGCKDVNRPVSSVAQVGKHF